MVSLIGPERPVAADLLSRIAATAAVSPTRLAVTQGEASLDYATLWRTANRVAAALAAHGVQSGDLVGVHAARTPSLLAVLLGVWRAGAAWLPLDPGFPEQRLALMCADAALRHLVSDRVAAWLPEAIAPIDVAALLADDASPAETTAGLTAPPACELSPDALAYVLYTSGSTGRPKGVEVTHGALANLLHAMVEAPGLSAPDVLVAVTTLSFDIAMLELWAPLLVGARVEIAPESEQLEPEQLSARLERAGATIMQATPVTWRLLLDAGWTGRLRTVLCGGEPFPPELVAPLLARAEAVWNLYGPTETTVWSTAARLTAPPSGVRVSAGTPIANTRLYVMGDDGAPVDEGEVGELWIGGAGVARGYRHGPELTAAVFVPEPGVPGGRAYRTGDRARIAADGTLELLGRIDGQIKLHGYRIEPAEVEAALRAQPGVAQAVVALAGPEDDRRLVAYVVRDRARADAATPTELRPALRARVPAYMVPAMVVEVDAMPLTPNGKLDRRALPDPFQRADTGVIDAEGQLRTDRERLLARSWCDVLGLQQVGRHDNFFELGGHSVLALRVVEQVRRDAGVSLDVRSLFFRSLAQVAEELS